MNYQVQGLVCPCNTPWNSVLPGPECSYHSQPLTDFFYHSQPLTDFFQQLEAEHAYKQLQFDFSGGAGE